MKLNLLRALSLILILSLTLSVCLCSCEIIPPQNNTPDENNGSENGGGEGDENGEGESGAQDPSKLYLTKDGKTNFSIVYNSASLTQELRTLLFGIGNTLKDYGITGVLQQDTFAAKPYEYEVLLGTFNGREDYTVSKYILGNKGYMIKVVDNKIIILGGNDESLYVAFEIFVNEYIMGKDYNNITIDRTLDRTVREKYDITSMSISGNDIADYRIVCDTSSPEILAAATLLRTALYDNAGYYLEISAHSKDTKAIYLTTEKDKSEDGFKVRVYGVSLYINCQYPTLFDKHMSDYVIYLTQDKSGDVLLDESSSYSKYIHSVCYSDFSAVGDGATDDFEAIKAAHEQANITGQTVVAEAGKTYYLGQHAECIVIKTDVDWTGACFIIDDSNIAPTDAASRNYIFSVRSDSQSNTKLTGVIKSLKKGQTNIGVTLDRDYMLVITNSNVKQYIRYGENADAGSDQQEIIIVRANGDIDPTTPLLWDYDTVTSIKAIPIDDTPITITGGSFTTIANQAPRQYTYYKRGIQINRSNVTLDGITHLITAEGDTGAPYEGFLSVAQAHNVLFENIVYSGHKTYTLLDNDKNSMGSYDIAASLSNKITWKNCTQANDILDKTRWGVMGSNYCKNLTYDGCSLSRFDAHKGMYNSAIINSEIGHAGITAIGSGTLLIEGTTVNSNSVVGLRGDYGSTWDGDVIIKDVILNNTNSSPTLFSGSWSNHYFGYTCYLPHSITVDNITVKRGSSITVLPSFGNSNISSASTNNPVVLTKEIIIKNNKNNYTFTVSSNSYIKNAATVKYE